MTEQEIIEASGGELCGGVLVARINDKNVALGKRAPGGQFHLTLDGVAFAEAYVAKPATAPKEVKASKKGKADDGKSHDLSFDELVETAEKLG